MKITTKIKMTMTKRNDKQISLHYRLAQFGMPCIEYLEMHDVHYVKSVRIWSVLVHIFPHSDCIQRDTPYLSLFGPNAENCGLEKLRIRTIFAQWQRIVLRCQPQHNLWMIAFLRRDFGEFMIYLNIILCWGL